MDKHCIYAVVQLVGRDAGHNKVITASSHSKSGTRPDQTKPDQPFFPPKKILTNNSFHLFLFLKLFFTRKFTPILSSSKFCLPNVPERLNMDQMPSKCSKSFQMPLNISKQLYNCLLIAPNGFKYIKYCPNSSKLLQMSPYSGQNR